MGKRSKTAQRTAKPAKRRPAKAVGSDTGSTWEKKKKRKKRMRKDTKEAFARLVEAVVANKPLPRFTDEILNSNDAVLKKVLEMRCLNKVKERENWKRIPKLKAPICTTPDDVVITGHGAYGTRLYRATDDTVVPEGVEFVLLAPLGATLTANVGYRLEAGVAIPKLGMKSPITGAIVTHQPIVYKAGDAVPNLGLDSPFDDKHPEKDLLLGFRPGGPKGIYLERGATPMLLDELWEQVEAHRQPGKVVRVYWAACAAIQDASEPSVMMDLDA